MSRHERETVTTFHFDDLPLQRNIFDPIAASYPSKFVIPGVHCIFTCEVMPDGITSSSGDVMSAGEISHFS